MASRMQGLNVRLSYLLEDLVAAYTDDGQDYLSVDRDLLLNTASRVLYDAFVVTYNSLLDRVKNRSRQEADPSVDILKDFVIVKAMTTVGVGGGFVDRATGESNCAGIWLDNWPSGNVYRVKRPLRLVADVSGGSSTEKKNYKIISEHDVPLLSSDGLSKFRSGIDSPMAYVTYNMSGTAKYLRMKPNQTSGQTVMFSWLQYPNTDLTSAGTEDIQWSSIFDTALLQIAYALSLRDDGKTPEYQAILQATLRELGVPADVNTEMAKQAMRGKP